MELPPVTLLILAGGASSRMGLDKASLPFPGPEDEPMIRRPHDRLRPVWSECIVAGPSTFSLDCRAVADVVGVPGPLGGLLAGLVASQSELVLATAADTPFPSCELASALILMAASRPHAEATFCLRDRRIEPLFAVYRKTAVTALTKAAGRLSGPHGLGLREAATALAQAQVPEIDWRRWDPDAASFRGCNTPLELAEAVRSAASEKEVQSERLV
ncbi:MAG: NTP transferase domain-containing protein [Candidatus Dormibacteria bacterium]